MSNQGFSSGDYTDLEKDARVLPLALLDEPDGLSECPEFIVLCGGEEQLVSLKKLVHLGLKAVQRENWQQKWRETRKMPNEKYLPATGNDARIAWAVDDATISTEPSLSCPPLPYGRYYGAFPPRTPPPTSNYENGIFRHTFDYPVLLYGQQVAQNNTDAYFFKDDFQRPAFDGAKYGWSGQLNLFQIVNNALKATFFGAYLSFPRSYRDYRANIEITPNVEGQVGFNFNFYLNYCDENNNVFLQLTTEDGYYVVYLVETIDGVSNYRIEGFTSREVQASDTVNLLINKNGFSLQVELKVSGVSVFIDAVSLASYCVASQRIQFGSTAISLNSIFFKPYNSSTVQDIFQEELFDLTSRIIQELKDVQNFYDLNFYNLGDIQLLVDYCRFDYSEPAGIPTQTTGIVSNQTAPIFHGTLDKTLLLGGGGLIGTSFHFGVYPSISPAYNMNLGRAFFIPTSLGDIDGVPYPFYLNSASIFMSYLLKIVNPASDQLQELTECRNGVRVYLKDISVATWRKNDKKPSSNYNLTGIGIPGSLTWGDTGWGGGIVSFDGSGYQQLYTGNSYRGDLYFDACQTFAKYEIFFNAPNDPLVDTDNDPDTPPVKVPQIYTVSIYFESRERGIIGDAQHTFIGEGEHYIEGVFNLPDLRVGIRGDKCLIAIKQENALQVTGFPLSITRINILSDYNC